MRILVVEDQKKVSAFIRKGLEEAGYAVDGAESGASAEMMVGHETYDLVILDVMLPDQNGIDTARHLRADGFSGPILMLTALSGTKDKVRGLDSGADDYMTKPFAFEELLARIRALLRRNDPTAPTKLIYEDLEMDLVTHQVTRAGISIALTQKEYALLEYLMRNANRPVTRMAISEHVWDVHFDSESNVIDVYVAMLRKKVDQPFSRKLIHTRVGVGYVLRAPEEDAERSAATL